MLVLQRNRIKELHDRRKFFFYPFQCRFIHQSTIIISMSMIINHITFLRTYYIYYIFLTQAFIQVNGQKRSVIGSGMVTQ